MKINDMSELMSYVSIANGKFYWATFIFYAFVAFILYHLIKIMIRHAQLDKLYTKLLNKNEQEKFVSAFKNMFILHVTSEFSDFSSIQNSSAFSQISSLFKKLKGTIENSQTFKIVARLLMNVAVFCKFTRTNIDSTNVSLSVLRI